MAGVFFHVVDIGLDAVVLVDMADAVEMHLFVAGRAAHAVAVDHTVQPLVKGRPALPATDAHSDIFDFVLVRIVHIISRLRVPRCAKRVDETLPQQRGVPRPARWSYTVTSWLAAESPKKPRRARITVAPRVNLPEWTVSELSAALKKTVEDAYGYVRVRGEVSGFKGASPSGHVYFRLKDDRAVLEGVIWKGVYGRMRVKPEEGLDVIVSGKLTTFAGSSKYQIVIDTLEPAGVGALMKLLEERKKKLAAEGLFDEARKQLLPFLPDVIGVVTSPTGAVIRDILHRLADRFPRRVLVWPVRVQGESSAAEVANAITRLQRVARARPAAAAGSDHRRARRRLARGPVVVQRGDRGARRGRRA